MEVDIYWHVQASLLPGRVPVAIEGNCLGPRAGLDGLYRRENFLFPPRIENWPFQIVENRLTDYVTPGLQIKTTNYTILSLVTVNRLVGKQLVFYNILFYILDCKMSIAIKKINL
jgi:hypothetical protein